MAGARPLWARTIINACLAASVTLLILISIGAVDALAGHPLGNRYVTYAGPKTWLPNYWEDSVYDIADDRWDENCFNDRNPEGWARTTFISSAGNWYESFAFNGESQWGVEHSPYYQKKSYCKNIDSYTYTGKCVGRRGA